MPFDEDDAIEIAFSESKIEEFDTKYPDAVYNIDKMKPKATEEWIAANPSANVGAKPPKNLWIVEIEQIGEEKLVAILSPVSKKVLETKIEGSEPIPDEEEEDEEEKEKPKKQSKPKKKKAKKKSKAKKKK